MTEEEYTNEKLLWMAKVHQFRTNEQDPDPDNTVDLYVVKPLENERDERDPSVQNDALEDVRLMLVADDPSDIDKINRIEEGMTRPSILFGKEKKKMVLPKIDLSRKIAQEFKKLFNSDADYKEFLESNWDELVNMDEMELTENADLAQKWNEDVKVNEYGVIEMKRGSTRKKEQKEKEEMASSRVMTRSMAKKLKQ